MDIQDIKMHIPLSRYEEMAGEAAAELREFRESFQRERLKNEARKLLGRGVREKDDIFWPAGLLLLGLLESGHIAEAEEYLQSWFREDMPVLRIDDALTGVSLIRLYEKTGRQEYRTAADKIYWFLETAARDEEKALIYNPKNGSRDIFADGIGMAVMFLSCYGKAFDRQDCLDEAAFLLKLYLKNGMDEHSGLCYHGYLSESETEIREEEGGIRTEVKKYHSVCCGLIGWGRAMGWLMMGMSCYLAACVTEEYSFGDPEETDSQITEIFYHFAELAEKTIGYIREDGLLPWLLPASRGRGDTSATGMIGWALVNACRNGWFAESELQKALEKMAEALHANVSGGRVGQSLAECLDFAMHPQQFGNYPWGQGAGLAYLSAYDEWRNL